jgi:DNA-binding MarR family transcriptional regulator
MGATDKRNMFFSLTEAGKLKLADLKNNMPAIPNLLA